MRPRPPSQIITYLEISESPPPFTHPITSTYATLDHFLCRKNFSAPSTLFHALPSPGSTAIFYSLPKSNYHFSFPRKLLHPPPRRDFTSSEAKLKYNTSTLTAFGIPTPQSKQSPPFHIYLYIYGSCPDQYHVSPQNPAGWGVFFENIFIPVGSLPFQVNGSNNAAELQAPLQAIAFMLLYPPLHPHIIFHLDSQCVIDLLLGLSLPSSNIELAILLLDFHHYLASRTYVELRKVKSHTGIPGNDRADLNASKGITSCTPMDGLPRSHH